MNCSRPQGCTAMAAPTRRRCHRRAQLSLLLLLCLPLLLHAQWGWRVTASASSSPSPTPSASSPPVDLISVDEVKYVVGLQRSPLSAGDSPGGADSGGGGEGGDASGGLAVVEMVSAQGRRFRCSIPPSTAPSTLAQPHLPPPATFPPPPSPVPAQVPPFDAQPTAASALPTEAPTTVSSPSPPSSAPLSSSPPSSLGAVSGRLRRSLRSGCFSRAVEWWTYEVCPFRAIRQFHHDGSPPAGPHGNFLSYQVTTAFSVGSYDADGDEWQRSPSGEWLYAQHYRGGAEGREATVRFLCPSSPQATATSPPGPAPASSPPPAHVLQSVQERPLHVYHFDVATPLACHHHFDKRGRAKAGGAMSDGTAKEASAGLRVDGSGGGAPLSSPPRPPPPSFPDASPDVELLLQLLHPLQDDCLHHVSGHRARRQRGG